MFLGALLHFNPAVLALAERRTSDRGADAES